MHRTRSTKIVATLGPSSSEPQVIEALFTAGVDVFRLNFSHGKHEEHLQRLQIIRQIEQKLNRPIGILADLQGPKIRVGKMKFGKAQLIAGTEFRLDNDPTPGDDCRAPLPRKEVFAALEEGTLLLLDDGRIRLKVLTAGKDFAVTEVIEGGPLTDNKGVNVPDAVLPLSALSNKDRDDLRFALDIGVDWVALSFVQRPEDIAEARRLIAGRAAVMAKIEKPAALDCIDEIVELADGIMIARGDLGVELPVEDVPGHQKHLIRLARRHGKPVVVATQMLESMVNNSIPTRAEVSDVAAAVWDGADAVMLSAETAAGDFPVHAVEVMNRVAHKVESDPLFRSLMDADHSDPEATAADAITAAARQVSETISAAAIASYTTSGSTALRAARERPKVPILVLTPRLSTARRLALAWGLHCVETDDAHSFGHMVSSACKIAKEENFASPGQRMVITAGVPFGTPGATNILRIAWVDQ